MLSGEATLFSLSPTMWRQFMLRIMKDVEPRESRTAIEPQLVASLLAEIARSEQHFNTLEAEYRKLASTWLLAAFAGMGYIATAKDLPVSAGPTVFLIAVGASLGIQLLWIVDLLTYHRLLLANFVEGWQLEKTHSFLPQVRANMLAQGNVGKRVRLFYLGSSLVPLAFGLVHCVTRLANSEGVYRLR